MFGKVEKWQFEIADAREFPIALSPSSLLYLHMARHATVHRVDNNHSNQIFAEATNKRCLLITHTHTHMRAHTHTHTNVIHNALRRWVEKVEV